MNTTILCIILIIVLLTIWWIYAFKNYVDIDYKVIILYLATIIGGGYTAYLIFNEYYNNTTIENNMKTNHIEFKNENDICNWIDEHPDVKIISITHIDTIISNEFVIFYQN